MIFVAQDEVHVPQDYAFSHFSDFISYEATALSYGADIRRVDGFQQVSQGVAWRGTVPIRGKTVGVEAKVTNFDPSRQSQMVTQAGGMTVTVDLSFEEMEPEKTRVTARAELRANTLAARLIVQSVRLARGSLQRRIDSKLVALGSKFEAEYHRSKASS